jgi:hypothetical protein
MDDHKMPSAAPPSPNPYCCFEERIQPEFGLLSYPGRRIELSALGAKSFIGEIQEEGFNRFHSPTAEKENTQQVFLQLAETPGHGFD